MRYNPGLDGLRGIAILGVLGFHAHLLPGGHLGVTVFFALSGYLITTLLLEEHARTGKVDLRAFYARRAVRLLPALLVVSTVLTLLLLLYAPSAVAEQNIRWGLLPTLTYTSNLIGATRGLDQLGVFVWSWSLALEEQFYLIWPPLLVVLLGRVRGRLWASVIAALGVAVSVLERAAWAETGSAGLQVLYVRPDCRMDALLVGCLAALLLRGRDSMRGTRMISMAALPLVPAAYLVASNAARPTYTWGMAVVETAAVILVMTALFEPDSAVAHLLRVPVLVHLGRTSYALYLWNEVTWPMSGGLQPAVRVPVFLVATVLLAEISTRWLERPLVRRWKARSAAEQASSTHPGAMDLTWVESAGETRPVPTHRASSRT